MMNDDLETRQIASFEAALKLGYGDHPQRAIQQLETLQQEVQHKENKGLIILYEVLFLGRLGVRGRLLATIGDWRLALPVLEESLSFERPMDGELYQSPGFCYLQAEKWDKAEVTLKLALPKKIIPSFSSAAHYYLGRIFWPKL